MTHRSRGFLGSIAGLIKDTAESASSAVRAVGDFASMAEDSAADARLRHKDLILARGAQSRRQVVAQAAAEFAEVQSSIREWIGDDEDRAADYDESVQEILAGMDEYEKRLRSRK